LLVWVAVAFSVIIPGIGLIQGKPLKDMVLTGLSLSFATIPEELPIVVTMVLGIGALALSRKHVLIRRLKAAETLGDVTVIVTDKTGTLTENKMTLAIIAANGAAKVFSKEDISDSDMLLLKIGVLTSSLKKTATGGFAGDPMEIALLEALKKSGISQQDWQGPVQLQKEFSFDNLRKMMSMLYQGPGGGFVFAKGAPEVILAKSSRIVHGGHEIGKYSSHESVVRDQVEGMAAEAMRVIDFA
jgi:Ca2+-transporting ATPase